MRWLTLFFIRTILSLSLSLSSSFQQLHCHNIFFPTNQLEQFFFLPFRQHRHKSIATIFFLQFSATSLPKLLLNFYHFSFFPPIFGNLVATILIFSLLTPLEFWQLGCHNSYFLSPHSPRISTTWLPQLVSFQPLLMRALHLVARQQIQVARISVMGIPKFKSSHHITCVSSLLLFVRISAIPLPKFTLFSQFAK